jgi:hypothetical protein
MKVPPVVSPGMAPATRPAPPGGHGHSASRQGSRPPPPPTFLPQINHSDLITTTFHPQTDRFDIVIHAPVAHTALLAAFAFLTLPTPFTHIAQAAFTHIAPVAPVTLFALLA